MLRVGLTGGLASGKSFVGKALAGFGCLLIQADELGHEVLLPGAEGYEPVIREFGQDVLDANGLIDRRRLAALVFSDPEKLKKLSGIVHPAVFAREQRIMEAAASTEPDAIIIVEAAILVETGSYLKFDRLIVVFCTREQQIERAMRRDGYGMEEVMARLERQLPLEEKKRLAHYVIDTSGAKEKTLEQTRKVYESLRELQK